MAKFLLGVGLAVAGALLLRTAGRLSTPAYTQFAAVLAAAQGRYSPATKAPMHQYDFTFGAWPVDFDVRQLEGDGSKPAPLHTGPGGAWWPLDMLGTVTFLYLNN